MTTDLKEITTEQIENYVLECQAAEIKDHNEQGFKNIEPAVISYKKLNVRYKLIRTAHGQASVHCFVDFHGNIFKADGWKKPANGVRGHILNENKPLLGGQYYAYR